MLLTVLDDEVLLSNISISQSKVLFPGHAAALEPVLRLLLASDASPCAANL